MTTNETPAAPRNTEEEMVGTLIEWAKLFEPIHQIILRRGAVQVSEYDRIWHDYKDKVRPIIESANPPSLAGES